jgi:hypothetical protein
MVPEETILTADDVAALNRNAVTRSAWIVRTAGVVLVVVGVVGFAGWVWFEVRLQQQLGGPRSSVTGGGLGQPNVDLVDRIDAFTQALTPGLIAAIVAGFGFAMRAMADYSVARVGGTLTAFVEGDEMVLDPAVEGDE